MVRGAARVLGVLALAGACRPNGASTPPGDPGAKTALGAITFAYRPARLTARAGVEITTNGGGRYVETTANLVAGIEVSAQGDGLVFAWAIEDVEDLALKGTIRKGDADLADYLVAHASGAWVIDAHGVEDLAASEAHPGNAARRDLLAAETARLARAREAGNELDPDPAATLLELFPPLLFPPPLPDAALEPGKTHEARATSELELPAFRIVLPIDTTTKTTLIGVDAAGSARIAELQLDISRYGGLDVEDEGTVELEERVEGTLLFDLDHGTLVRVELTSTQSFTAGERSGDTTTLVRAELERR
jgi:hypothetical protein